MSQELIKYEKRFIEEIGKYTDNLYYFFDYDERSADINMEFQHFHRFYEILILLDKSASHLVDGRRFELIQNDITLLPPLKLHKSIYPEGDPVRRLVIDFMLPAETESALAKDITDLLALFHSDNLILRFNEAEQAETFSYLNKIQDLLRYRAPGYTLQVHTCFLQFLYCLNKYASHNLYKDVTSNSIEDKIYQITAYIHSHYQEELSLEEIADKFYISTYYLSHQFKAVTGFTLVNYVQMTRIRNAEQMLLSGKAKITDIATQCGFNSFSQFNRTFNKFVGKSPSEFRNAPIRKSEK